MSLVYESNDLRLVLQEEKELRLTINALRRKLTQVSKRRFEITRELLAQQAKQEGALK